MRLLGLAALCLAALFMFAALYVRLAPVDAARWHVAPDRDAPGTEAGPGRYLAAWRITTTPEAVLEAVSRVALDWPRTRLLAGSVKEGMLTFETRTALMRFPDYTTIAVVEAEDAALLVIHARLRFGHADGGVNRARVTAWLDRLGPLVVPVT